MAIDSLRQSTLWAEPPPSADDNGRLQPHTALRARPISSGASCGPDDTPARVI